MITLRKISGSAVPAYSTFLEVLIEMHSDSSFACLTLRMQGSCTVSSDLLTGTGYGEAIAQSPLNRQRGKLLAVCFSIAYLISCVTGGDALSRSAIA